VRFLDVLPDKAMTQCLHRQQTKTRADYRKLEKQIVAAQKHLRVLLDRTDKAY